jgi:hypothetical protein
MNSKTTMEKGEKKMAFEKVALTGELLIDGCWGNHLGQSF